MSDSATRSVIDRGVGSAPRPSDFRSLNLTTRRSPTSSPDPVAETGCGNGTVFSRTASKGPYAGGAASAAAYASGDASTMTVAEAADSRGR